MMASEKLHQQGNVLVRRSRLEPGDATPWHRDHCSRVTVVMSGGPLLIEYRDGSRPVRVEVAAGQVDWDEPEERVHRAVNVGIQPYEEVTVFLLDRPDAAPQSVES